MSRKHKPMIETRDTIEKRDYIDTLRLSISEDNIYMDFGEMKVCGEQKYTVDVRSKIKMSPEDLGQFVLYLIKVGIEYEKTYKKSLGFENIIEK